MKKEFTRRTAQPGDGEAIFHVTRQSITELSNGLYTPEQLNGWMGERPPEFYERLLKQGQLVVALQLGRIVGFVDSEPGEVTRLFLLREASSKAKVSFGTIRLVNEVGSNNWLYHVTTAHPRHVVRRI